ncbi:Uncharacterised protein [Porphyromonas cangingivalis]|uniref:DUF4294 domain-containing protein n=1 Tax=Porphyromonas cangingivalis TaxID=36874 RepID=A0A1T4JTT5_PORCN|nr:DUF4294 domain-containing protein [Porphyromonas cangingivalis]SJZ33515.1 protein of unknown function [Porphyromonas cangingivalis]VEJ04748.1 Uncharacterised protein [Porphyromonas cangingivalis]
MNKVLSIRLIRRLLHLIRKDSVREGRASSLLLVVLLSCSLPVIAQDGSSFPPTNRGYIVNATLEGGDTIPIIKLRTLNVFAPLEFKSEKEKLEYLRLIRDVKRTLPYARMISSTMKETYEYIETLPTDKERLAHLKRMEDELYKEYFPEMKKLTLRQGKLLIKLIDRQCGSSGFELVEAFLGTISANIWNLFAKFFGASLKSSYDPQNKDALTERVVILVENGVL